MGTALPVAGYYRVSQARDGMRAPEMYADEIERYCTYRKLHLTETFSDIDFSGYRGSKPRPALEDLKTRRFEFSAIVIPKLSRFGRSVKDLVALFDLFDRDGIALVFLDMNIDTSTSQGRLLRHIMAAFAEYESDVKSDYSKATQRLLAREGRPVGGWAPFGYRIMGERAAKTYVIDEPAATIVRDLFHRYLDGTSLTHLARDLNARGITGPRGGDWSRQRVKTILDNLSYAAFRIYEGDEFAAKWPPLVSREVWDACKAKRHASRSTYVDPPGRRNHLLSGLLVCGLCGRNLHYGYANGRVGIYRCTTGDNRPPRCLGGQIKAARAEHLITQAYMDALDLANSSTGQGWNDGSIDQRRDLLSAAIESVVLLAKPAGNRNGKGQPIGRRIKIHWASVFSVEAFGYASATSTLTPRDQRISSSRGKTWDEWRRARLVPR